jgi:putative acetyltransferase
LRGTFSSVPWSSNRRGAGRKAGGLAMAVLPSFQRQEFGSLLVRKGLSRMRNAGCRFVVVLVHPGDSPRFGFERPPEYGVRCQREGAPVAAPRMGPGRINGFHCL